MKIEPYPNEQGRFRVYSSLDLPPYNVDLAYRGESGKEKPRAVCDCPAIQYKRTKYCKHIEAVVRYEAKGIAVLREIQQIKALPY